MSNPYLAEVAAVPCLICGRPAEVHHRRTGTGAGKRAPDSETMALCPEHHRGNKGLHGMGRKAFEKHYGITEQEMIEATRKIVERNRRRRISFRTTP